MAIDDEFSSGRLYPKACSSRKKTKTYICINKPQLDINIPLVLNGLPRACMTRRTTLLVRHDAFVWRHIRRVWQTSPRRSHFLTSRYERLAVFGFFPSFICGLRQANRSSLLALRCSYCQENMVVLTRDERARFCCYSVAVVRLRNITCWGNQAAWKRCSSQ